jgi:replicative DNA helicase
VISSTDIQRRREALESAERALLGAVLLDPEALEEMDGLRAEDFYGHAEATCYRSMLAMRKAGQVIDYQSLDLELVRQGQALGIAWVTALTDYCPSLSSVSTYAQQVRDASRSRALRAAAVAAIRTLDGGEPALDVAASLAAALGGGLFSDTGIYSMREVLADTWTLVERCQEGTGQIMTGIPEMDKGGLTPMPGEYVVIGARPNVGKTMLALHIARQMALRGEGVLVASLEMTRALLGVRHLSTHTGIPGEAMLGYRSLSIGQYSRLGAAVQQLADVPIWTYLDRDLGRLVAAAKRTAATRGIRALMVDYIGLLEIQDEERRELEIAMASAALSGLAHETDMVIYALCQLNRGVESREDHHPRMSDLRESGAIEQDADRVWLLYRPGIGTGDDHVLEVCQAKSRNGPAGQLVRVPYLGGRLSDGQPKEWSE